MQTTNCKVFIGGLSYGTTDESLANYFQSYGVVKDAVVMRTMQGQSRGFGFCVFQNSRSCQAVLKNKNHVIDNRRVDVRLALSKDEAPPPQASDGATKLNVNKIFVGGLHYQTSPDDLIQYFSTFGDVESANVVYNHENHKSRGFGFIIFKDKSSVKKVMSVSDHVIMGRKVEVKKAVPKEIEDTGPNSNEDNLKLSVSGIDERMSRGETMNRFSKVREVHGKVDSLVSMKSSDFYPLSQPNLSYRMSNHSTMLRSEDYTSQSSGLLPSFESSEPFEPYSPYRSYSSTTERWESDFYSSGRTQQGGLTGLSLSPSYSPGFSQSLTDLPLNSMSLSSSIGGSFQDTTREGEIASEPQSMFGEGTNQNSFYDYRQTGLKMESGNPYLWESPLFFENNDSFH